MTSRRENCLSKPQYRGVHLAPGETLDLIRAAQQGNVRAKNERFAPRDKLLAAYHKAILKHLAESAYYGPPPDELMGAALEGFSYAITKFNLRSNNGFWAYAQHCIRGRVLDFIKECRRDGITGRDTRASRELFANPNVDAEELVKKGAYKSQDAAQKAIDAADLESVHYDTIESNQYDEGGRSQSFENGEVAAEFRAKYSCCDKYSLSPQLKILRRSEKGTWDEEKDFERLRREDSERWRKTNFRNRVDMMARPGRYREPSADLRTAAKSRWYQQQDWFLEPEPEKWAQWRVLEPQRLLLVRTTMAMQRDARLKQRTAIHEPKRKRNVRTESKQQANGSAVAPVVVLESRRSRATRLHVSLRHMPKGIGERFACTRAAW